MSTPTAPGVAALDRSWIPPSVKTAAEDLTAPPDAVRRALDLIEGGRAGAREVSACLEETPEVAGKVVRIANRGFPQATGSLHQAVARVGDSALSALLLATCLEPRYETPLPPYRIGRGVFMRHSEAVAGAAQAISQRIAPRHAPLARLAGFLHDVGKLVLACMETPSDGPAEPAPADRDRITAWERRRFGVAHDQIGAWLCRTWSAPAELVVAIDTHHQLAPPDMPVARALWLADLVTHASGNPVRADQARAACTAAGLDPGWVARACNVDLRPECPLTNLERIALRTLADFRDSTAAAEFLGIRRELLAARVARACRTLEVDSPARAIRVARLTGWI